MRRDGARPQVAEAGPPPLELGTPGVGHGDGDPDADEVGRH